MTADAILEFTVAEPTPSANAWAKAHWSRYYRIREHWFKLLTDQLLLEYGGLSGFRDYARAELTVQRYSTHLLDPDNLIGGLKPIIDILRCATPAELSRYQSTNTRSRGSFRFHHLGIFQDDTEDALTIAAAQSRVHKQSQRRTEFQILLYC